MNNLRLWVFAAILWLIAILNVERPNAILNMGQINLASMVYVLVAAIFVVELTALGFNRSSFSVKVSIWVALYAVLKHMDIALPDAMGQAVTYLEIQILIVTIWLAHKISASMIDYESEIDKAVLKCADLDYETLSVDKEAIEDELVRARRYGYPIALLRVEFPDLPNSYGASSARWDRKMAVEINFIRALIAQHVHDILLDSSDIIGWQRDSLLVTLVEKDRDAVAKFVGSLRELCEIVLETTPTIGMALFPEDALVLSDLIEMARQTNLPAAVHPTDLERIDNPKFVSNWPTLQPEPIPRSVWTDHQ